jgi:hypothetical protein
MTTLLKKFSHMRCYNNSVATSSHVIKIYVWFMHRQSKNQIILKSVQCSTLAFRKGKNAGLKDRYAMYVCYFNFWIRFTKCGLMSLAPKSTQLHNFLFSMAMNTNNTMSAQTCHAWAIQLQKNQLLLKYVSYRMLNNMAATHRFPFSCQCESRN